MIKRIFLHTGCQLCHFSISEVRRCAGHWVHSATELTFEIPDEIWEQATT